MERISSFGFPSHPLEEANGETECARNDDASRSSGRWTAISAACFAALIGWTVVLAFYDLDGGARFEPTDAWVAQTAREMLESHEWIIPRFSGEVRLQKSPGPYWVVMAVSLLRGGSVDEVSTRIPNAVAAVVLVAMVFWLARRIAGERAAIFAGFAASSSVLVLYWSHRGASDMGLTALLTVSLGTLWAGSGHEAAGWKRNFLWMVGYFAAGCAMIYKLPMPLACIGIPAVVYVVVQRKWNIFRSWWHIAGLVLFCVPWLPWVILVCATEPTAIFKWRVEFWDRFTGALPNVEAQKRWHYYFLYLIPIAVFTLPYTLSVPGAVLRAFRERHRLHADGLRFLVIWFVSLFVFFTAAAGKETRYFLPALPPLFVLLGIELAAFFDPERVVTKGRLRAGQWAVWILLPAGLIGGGWGAYTWTQRQGAFSWTEVQTAYLVLAVVLGAGWSLAAWLFERRRSWSFGLTVVTTWAAWCIAWTWLFPVVVAQRPFVDFAEQLRDRFPKSLRPRLTQIAQQDPRIIWYSDVRFPRVIDQFDLLARQGFQRSTETERRLVGEAVLKRLARNEPALFVATRSDYLEFLTEGRAALARKDRSMPATHLWLQSRVGAKKHQFVLFGNLRPPWPEPELTPPSERLVVQDVEPPLEDR